MVGCAFEKCGLFLCVVKFLHIDLFIVLPSNPCDVCRVSRFIPDIGNVSILSLFFFFFIVTMARGFSNLSVFSKNSRSFQ